MKRFRPSSRRQKLSRPNRVRWDTVQHIWLQPLQSQIVKALTFSCCPAGAQQQRSQQRSNPSGSSAPHRHVAEYNPACQGGMTVRPLSSLLLLSSPLLSSSWLAALLRLWRMLSRRLRSVKWWRGKQEGGLFTGLLLLLLVHRLPHSWGRREKREKEGEEEFLEGVPCRIAFSSAQDAGLSSFQAKQVCQVWGQDQSYLHPD